MTTWPLESPTAAQRKRDSWTLNRLVKMKEITEKINQELQTTNEEEEQLKQFSEALIKLGNKIRTTIILCYRSLCQCYLWFLDCECSFQLLHIVTYFKIHVSPELNGDQSAEQRKVESSRKDRRQNDVCGKLDILLVYAAGVWGSNVWSANRENTLKDSLRNLTMPSSASASLRSLQRSPHLPRASPEISQFSPITPLVHYWVESGAELISLSITV